ncbi:peptidase M23 family protein [Streptomyces sp. NBRC 110611]|uniref:M23 family metallopeptidase n=1 Tax=Streptomyces sp. NBRC 110611 TaxID=1621259 RepID=UPI000834F8D3|nr:M23 family metallopeptidase [Streptomyces sp. NBRC 110611]GAU68675.1 peptidase M23 family protein [Streptomyces sp. NBRC 110611]
MTTFRKSTPSRPRTPLRSWLLRVTTPVALGSVLVLTVPQAIRAAPAAEPAAAAEPWPPADADTWTRPLKAWTHYHISVPYGVPGDWQAGRHTGVDIAVRPGVRVRSVGTGTVVHTNKAGDYGKAVTVRMNDGHYTLFAHLSRITVHPGQRVRARTRLGYSGSSGRSTGPHLHFEVRATRHYGSDIDPLTYLADHGVRLPAHLLDD